MVAKFLLDRRVAQLGVSVLLCALCLQGLAQAPATTERAGTARSDQGGTWIRVVKPVVLNTILRTLAPADQLARDAYRAAIIAANPLQFPDADNPGKVALPVGTRLFFPAGIPIPPPSVAMAANGPGGQTNGTGQPALGAVALAASQRKITTCLPRIDEVSKALSEGAKAGVFLFNSLVDPDKKIMSTSMEIGDGAKSSYASATFAPVGSRGCSVSAEVVTWWPANCAEVMTKAFPQVTVSAPLMRDIRITEAGATMRVFFMPAGNGCVTIKKEVLF